jgi:hypothetical protein
MIPTVTMCAYRRAKGADIATHYSLANVGVTQVEEIKRIPQIHSQGNDRTIIYLEFNFFNLTFLIFL